MFRKRRTHGWVAVATLALAASACDAGTAPDVSSELNTDEAQADFEALQTALTSDELAGFRALAGRTPFDEGPAAVGAMAGTLVRNADEGGAAFVLGLARRLAAGPTRSEAATGPIISGWHRGTTFVYSAERDTYEPDLTLEGAPETGVRFILYDVDAEGRPVPGEESGYADLIDEGDGSAEDISLRLVVIQHEETVLDYATTLDHDATRAGLTVGGFLFGDGVRLDFDVTVAARDLDGVAQLDLDFELAVASRDFQITGSFRGVEEDDDDGDGEIHLDVRHGQNRIELDMMGTEGVLDGTVALDGAPFALVSGPSDDSSITDPSGEALTWPEIVVLMKVVDVVEDVFDLLEDLLDPVGNLVLLGWVL